MVGIERGILSCSTAIHLSVYRNYLTPKRRSE